MVSCSAERLTGWLIIFIPAHLALLRPQSSVASIRLGPGQMEDAIAFVWRNGPTVASKRLLCNASARSAALMQG